MSRLRLCLDVLRLVVGVHGCLHPQNQTALSSPSNGTKPEKLETCEDHDKYIVIGSDKWARLARHMYTQNRSKSALRDHDVAVSLSDLDPLYLSLMAIRMHA